MFIVFEGIDGSGKSTQCEMLFDYLKKQGKDVILTKEPGGSEIGQQIREVLKNPKNKSMTNLTELLLMNASRAQILEEIIYPTLQKGSIVVLDRFNPSTYAYQGYGRGLNIKLIKKLDKVVVSKKPDVVFFLDIDYADTLKRKGSDNDRFERSGKDFYNRVYAGYKKLAKQNKTFITIDAKQSKEKIHEEITSILKRKGII